MVGRPTDRGAEDFEPGTGVPMKRLKEACNKVFGRLSSSRVTNLPVVLLPAGEERGAVSISYISRPLRGTPAGSNARGHSNASEVVAMTEVWREEGFRVEVCDYNDRSYRPPSDCVVAIDIHDNLQRWVSRGGSFRKVHHATGCHWRFQNDAEIRRLAALRDRRGVDLQARRQVAPSRGAELADEITVLGNGFTVDTFRFAGKPITRIPISSAYGFAWPHDREFSRAKTRFLWLGSYGMVHKGLDLVLEAFRNMPHLQLSVCGRPEKEDDFYRLYETELTHTANIKFYGWIDMASPVFAEIARTHAAVIYPSCSEGGGGAVIHCMHAGLMPITTPEASVDLGDFGISIEDGTVEAVAKAAEHAALLDTKETECRARAAWEYARSNHTLDKFRSAYREFVRTFLQKERSR